MFVVAAAVLVCTVVAIVVYRRKHATETVKTEFDRYAGDDDGDNDPAVPYAWQTSSRSSSMLGSTMYARPDDEPVYGDVLPVAIDTPRSFASTRPRPDSVADYDLAAPTHEPQYALASPADDIKYADGPVVPPRRGEHAVDTLFNPMYSLDDDDGNNAVEMYVDVSDGEDEDENENVAVRNEPHVYLQPVPAAAAAAADNEDDGQLVYTVVAQSKAADGDVIYTTPVLPDRGKVHTIPSTYAARPPAGDGYNPYIARSSTTESPYDNAAPS